jgi:hypothetical protein
MAAPMSYADWLKYHGYNKSTSAYATAYAAYKKAHTAAPTPAPANQTKPTVDTQEYIRQPDWVGGTIPQSTQDEINYLIGQRDALQGIGNSDRLSAAQALQNQMLRGGMWNPSENAANTDLYSTAEDNGNKTFTFNTSGLKEGNAYRDVYRNSNNQAAQRGFGSSSDKWDAWLKGRSNLNNQQAAAMESYSTNQRNSIDTQKRNWNAYNAQVGIAQGKAAETAAAQEAPIMKNPNFGKYVDQPSGTAYQNSQTYKFKPKTSTLAGRFPGGYGLTQSGNNWIVSW